MLQDLTHDVVYLPGSEDQLARLVTRLRNELNEHFSFAPKSDARLEEVVLGTLGMPNGRQQWQGLLNRPIIDANLNNELLELLTQRRVSPNLHALMHHDDRQVRAMAQTLLGLAENTLVITFTYADMEGLEYGEHLNRQEVKACFRYAEKHLDAAQGMNWEALDDAAQAIFHQRVFYPNGHTGEHGIRYFGPFELSKDTPKSGWYDQDGIEYFLVLPEEGEDEEEPFFLDANDDLLPGLWKPLAR